MVARIFRAVLLSVTALSLAACGDDAVQEAAAAAERSSNRAPVISGSPERTAFAGEIYSFAPTATDPDGDPLQFGVDGLPGWLTFNNRTGGLTGTPRDSDIGEYRGIVVRVSDGRTDSLLPALDIAVLPKRRRDNQPPLIAGAPTDVVIVGGSYDFLPIVKDADGDPLSYSIENRPPWATFDPATGRLSGTPDGSAIGTYAGIVIAVSDPVATTTLGPFAIAVNPLPANNRAPVILGTPAAAVTVGQTWSFQPQAADPDGDPLSFQVAGAPAWMTLNDATGLLGGMPGATDVGRHSGIQLIVTDGEASALLPPFFVDVISPNGGPAIGGTPQSSIPKGQPFSFTPTASDPNGDTLTFTVTGLPAWATFNGLTGRLAGTPGTSGTFADIVISVSDGQESVSLPPFAIVVVNSPPEIGGSPATAVVQGMAYSFTPSASDPNGDAVSFTASGVPSWAGFNPATGQLSGIAAGAGTFSGIVITAHDGEASASLPAFSITVSVQNLPPLISGSPSGSVARGQLYSFTPTASDPNGDALSFTVSGLPAWASFDGTTGQLSGVPVTLGTWSNIVITASDGQVSASLPGFSIAVANLPPVISGTPVDTVLVDSAYQFTPAANDPDGDALTFGVAGLPVWASFNAATGTVSGTPTASHVGDYGGIAIAASDGSTSATLGPFSIRVQALATGAALLSWMVPTENADGTPLTDLAGFVVYWGTSSRNYPSSFRLTNAAATSFVVDNLLAGRTYYFALTAFNASGAESDYSNEASKLIP